ncbi:unnamed protein product [Linum trigynum]|uniref:GRF-type domain-containing protein n=1 Tax=Linum trigynum TaxID=586398 RepID=A0AAV2D6D0_9ROSI
MASRRNWANLVDDFEYDEEEVKCGCGLRAARKISHTTKNPNRKFFGCPKYGSKTSEPCDFFQWYDIRVAVFKSTRMLSELVAKLTLENEELRASLERLGARLAKETATPCCVEISEELQTVKQRLEHLELESSRRK